MLSALSTLEKLGLKTQDMTVAVQGFGNVGSMGAKLLQEQGFKIVALGDAFVSLYKKDGINVKAAIEYANNNKKSLRGYTEEDLQSISNKDLLALNVDILFLAALENQLRKNNANNVRAKIVVEGANGPTSKDADKILENKGIIIVPDILANAGGVVVSYFEWVQNGQSFMWDEQYVTTTLKRIMKKAFTDVWNVHIEKKVPLRMAAYMVALNRIVQAKKLRCIFH
ncbi:glutamate dehydrogenase/leucine dehydrogenase [Sporomusaceae bacterium BoRhaA]|nr:glutamate dehydrogenase/leucine dehydrogenase [Pelorhabdus rhamnosifermentans]